MVYIIPTQFPLAKASHMDKANITGQGEEQMLFPEDALSVTWPRTQTQNPHTLWLVSKLLSQAKCGLWIVVISPWAKNVFI